MRKAQELSLNLVVVGVLALLVLVIVGGVMIFGGGDLFNSLSGMAPTDSATLTTFLTDCQQKCQTINLMKGSGDLTATQAQIFCCADDDMDDDGEVTINGELGPEICALAYSDCEVDGENPASFCVGATYDYTSPDEFGAGGLPGCNLN